MKRIRAFNGRASKVAFWKRSGAVDRAEADPVNGDAAGDVISIEVLDTCEKEWDDGIAEQKRVEMDKASCRECTEVDGLPAGADDVEARKLS